MKLYIYDHCPFCVRARMIFGLRDVPFETAVFLNDDEENPIRMIGAKQVPILEKDDGSFMGESLDIVRYIDEWAGKGRLNEEIRPQLQAWLDKVSEYNNQLAQPRMVKIGLPEFATESAIDYFVNKKEKNIGSFAENLEKTAQYVARLNADLLELEGLVNSSDGINGEVSMEDIIAFPILRNLTIVQGVAWPQKVKDYVVAMSEKSGVPLYFNQAI